MVLCDTLRTFDEDSVSVCTTCPSQDDHIRSPRENAILDDCELGNANISSVKTASFWDDREMSEAIDSSPQDPTQHPDVSVCHGSSCPTPRHPYCCMHQRVPSA
mmetsp:Transcript_10729/g.17000  ORF Transcript_10729/g.17000 Transcript_10729/m.17000 type:complete len:104 (-) Transcript_10729:815-1126(-)